MYEVQEILDFFISQEMVETMGNWWPRVVAVMSCVIPFMYILFAMVCVILLLFSVYRLVGKC